MDENNQRTTVNAIPTRFRYVRMVQNFLLVWLDATIDEINNDDCRDAITQLRQVINAIYTFVDVDECVDFITSVQTDNIFLIVSGPLGQRMVSMIHNITQLFAIYIFCGNREKHDQWARQWSKIRGVFTDIRPICDELKQATRDCDQNSVSISFVKQTSGIQSRSLDELDPSFMYTQILKEILLTIDFEQKHINDFLTYCRELFVGNTNELRNIDMCEREYRDHQPIWWYTYPCFLYSMLNRALRTMEVDLIINMGFFIRDLYNHIAKLHIEQCGGHHYSGSFTVYRGQYLSYADFDQLKVTQGGLLAFNNFLSTSLDRDISLSFAQRTMNTSNLVGVLFVMEIDPSISTTPFANVRNASNYKDEEEILFSMHSVFRIKQIQQIENNNRVWQVELTLTSDNDLQLNALTRYIKNETFSSYSGWYRLGQLLLRLGEFVKAEQVYQMILEQTTHEHEIGSIYNNLGILMRDQGKYNDAIEYYEKAVEIYQKNMPSNHPSLATSYNNIGAVYQNMGEYVKAFSNYEKALEIFRNILPPNHPSLATSYNNIGAVYQSMGEYSKALLFYEKALEIYQKTLPANHPDLAMSYNNIGLVYEDMGEYSRALSSFEKVLEIYQKTLPPNHPILATSYNNIGGIYDSIGEYQKALSYLERALEIKQKSLPTNHPTLASSYSNIGLLYYKMGEHSKALSFLKKAVHIYQRTLPSKHPNLAISYNNIALVYDNIGEYSEALSVHEKALQIRQEILPLNHPDFAISYNNIGLVYDKLDNCAEALRYYEKALEIYQKSLPANHPTLAAVYNNIGEVYFKMKEYTEALSYYKKALNIQQHSLPPNHPDTKTSRENIEKIKMQL